MGTQLKLTTKYFARHSAAIQNPSQRYAKHSGAWQAILGRWAKHNGTWQLTASTPSVTAGGGGAATGSGASGSGTASVGLTATSGGYNSGNLSYEWFRASGANYGIDNANAQNPNISYAFAGVGAGVTSSLPSEQWYCVITDNVTGAKYQSDNITVGPLAWHNTTSAYTNMSLSGPTEVSDQCDVAFAPGNCTSSPSVTLVLTGGSSPAITWTYLSGTAGLTESGQGTLTFTVSKSLFVGSVGDGESASATYRCAAHDGIGPDATHDVTFDLTSFGQND